MPSIPNSVNTLHSETKLSNSHSVVQDPPFQSPTKDDEEEDDGEYIPPMEEEEGEDDVENDDGEVGEGGTVQDDTLDEELIEIEGLGADTDFFNDPDLGLF